MLVTKTSLVSGKDHTLDLPVTEEQLNRYASGHELIQNVFPELTDAQREFLMSGITEEEWDAIFPEEDE